MLSSSKPKQSERAIDSHLSPAPHDAESGLHVQSLEKGLAVLKCFDASHQTLNLPEIASAAGISKSAAQRFAFTLERLGYMSKDPATKRYALTPRVLELGFHYLMADPLVERASPYLLDLNRRCRETVNLARPEGTDMVFVARFPSYRVMPVHMPVGRRLPMFCTASGRAHLAALPPDAALDLLERSNRLRYTPTTATEIPALLDLLAEARERGFSTANGEYFQSDLGVGMAIVGPGGRAIASVNVSASAARSSLERMIVKLVPFLRETVSLINTAAPPPVEADPFRIGLRLPTRSRT